MKLICMFYFLNLSSSYFGPHCEKIGLQARHEPAPEDGRMFEISGLESTFYVSSLQFYYTNHHSKK